MCCLCPECVLFVPSCIWVHLYAYYVIQAFFERLRPLLHSRLLAFELNLIAFATRCIQIIFALTVHSPECICSAFCMIHCMAFACILYCMHFAIAAFNCILVRMHFSSDAFECIHEPLRILMHCEASAFWNSRILMHKRHCLGRALYCIHDLQHGHAFTCIADTLHSYPVPYKCILTTYVIRCILTTRYILMWCMECIENEAYTEWSMSNMKVYAL